MSVIATIEGLAVLTLCNTLQLLALSDAPFEQYAPKRLRAGLMTFEFDFVL